MKHAAPVSDRTIAVAIGCGLALAAAFPLRSLLVADTGLLPGRDAVNLYYWELFTRSALASGRLPHWNPYHFAGFPHLSDPQTTVLYPPAMALRWLAPAPFLVWMAALHVWWGGVGALTLARVLGLGWSAAAAAAIAVMLGGSTGPWLHNGHLLLLYCAAWLPWCLALAIVSARRMTLMPHPALVAVTVMVFLAGYLQGALYVSGVVGLYYLWTVAWPERGVAARVRYRPIAQLVVLAASAAGLSAVQLLPTLELVSQAARASGVAYGDAIKDAWTVQDLGRIVFPFAGVADDPPHRALSDSAVYVGWVLSCLVPFAFLDAARRRVVVFLSLLAGAAIVLALGDQLGAYRLHHALLPGFRVPGRVLFLATLALGLLGALGLERFIRAAAHREWRTLAVGTTMTTLAIGAAVVALSNRANVAAPSHLWPWLSVAGVAGLLAIAASSAKGRVASASALALTLVGVDLSAYVAGSVDPVDVQPVGQLRAWLGPPERGRLLSACENVVGAGELLSAGRPTLDGLAGITLRGYTDWAHMVRTGERPDADGFYQRIGDDRGLPARLDLLNTANVASIAACEDVGAHGLALVKEGAPLRIYRNDEAWPRAVWVCEPEAVSYGGAIDRLISGRYAADGMLVPVHYINVRWTAAAAGEERRAAEEQYGLREGVWLEGTTWRYVLADTTMPTLTALLHDPDVEDTHGVDRSSRTVTPQPPRASDGAPDQLLVGTASCSSTATIALRDRGVADGRLDAAVQATQDGFLFVSDAFYSERHAFVDGVRVAASRANLAFTAIPVPAGSHRVELRYVPNQFHLGATVSAATGVLWGAAFLVGRARRRRVVPAPRPQGTAV